MKKLMKRTLAISLSTVLLLCTEAGASNAHIRAEERQIGERETYIVQTVTEKKMDTLDKEYEESATISDLGTDSMKEAHFTTLELTDGEAESLEMDNKVTVIEKDIEVRGASEGKMQVSPSGEKDDMDWNMQAIRLDEKESPEEGSGNGNKVKVALIDSGVDMFNDIEVEDYINLIPGEEEVLPLFWDTSGHGTSIAGVIAAQDNEEGITGIAPGIELYSARVLDENKTAPVSRIVEAIYWAIEKKVNIISLSFGTTIPSEALETAIKAAHKKGILIVAAAGNHGVVEYPAAMDEVMAVGGTDTDGTVCDYSAEGEQVEIVAPAEKIESTGGFGGTLVCNGTSMAVPHVVGVAARLWEKDRTKSADFIRQLMDVAANQYGDADQYGNGLLDYQQAVEIYDEFEDSYNPNKTVEENGEDVTENDTPVQGFTDVDCVNGSWYISNERHEGYETHVDIAQEALEKNGYMNKNASNATNAYVISMVKKGAVYPDKPEGKVQGSRKNPCMHGFFRTTTGKNTSNYIQNYIICTQYAKAIREGKIYGQPKTYNVNNPSQAFQKLFADVSLGSFGGSPLCKAAFGYGVAIHTATDVYAHSVWTKKYGRLYHHKESGNDYADKSTIVKERFQAAKDLAVNILRHFKNNTVGTVTDFCTSSQYQKNTFKLYYFEDFIKVYDPALAKKMSAYSIRL